MTRFNTHWRVCNDEIDGHHRLWLTEYNHDWTADYSSAYQFPTLEGARDAAAHNDGLVVKVTRHTIGRAQQCPW